LRERSGGKKNEEKVHKGISGGFTNGFGRRHFGGNTDWMKKEMRKKTKMHGGGTREGTGTQKTLRTPHGKQNLEKRRIARGGKKSARGRRREKGETSEKKREKSKWGGEKDGNVRIWRFRDNVPISREGGGGGSYKERENLTKKSSWKKKGVYGGKESNDRKNGAHP